MLEKSSKMLGEKKKYRTFAPGLEKVIYIGID